MAKIRVYELARDLNMTNKSLIEKIKDMDIDVEIKSHMSALEDEAVAQIKAGLFGQKSETVVETRVKPTVIRRRKKTVTVEVQPEIEAAEEAAEEEMYLDDDDWAASIELATQDIDGKVVGLEELLIHEEKKAVWNKAISKLFKIGCGRLKPLHKSWRRPAMRSGRMQQISSVVN